MSQSPGPIPAHDLYACLGVAVDADVAAIDRAWRSLLKRHHPDVAGTTSLEVAKLINVAHDWLSRPALRARYDAARRRRTAVTAGRPAGARPTSGTRQAGRHDRTTGRRAARARPPGRPLYREPDELDTIHGPVAEAVREFLHVAARLTVDDVDRLRVSDPLVFAPSVRAFVPPELWERVEDLEARLRTVLPARAWADERVRSSACSFGHALVLELFLWHYLDNAEMIVERMRRGWELCVGLPRYGPNTAEVLGVVTNLGRLTATQARRLAAGWSTIDEDEPWPADASEYDYTALEVSAALARRDAAAVPLPARLRPDEAAAVRAAFARTVHVITLRPIFSLREYARLRVPWQETLGRSPAAAAFRAGPTVRRT